jgi:hypothetical protein
MNILTPHIFNFMDLVKLVSGLPMFLYNNLPMPGKLQISIITSDDKALSYVTYTFPLAINLCYSIPDNTNFF